MGLRSYSQNPKILGEQLLPLLPQRRPLCLWKPPSRKKTLPLNDAHSSLHEIQISLSSWLTNSTVPATVLLLQYYDSNKI